MRQSGIIGIMQLALVCGLALGCTVETGEEESAGYVDQESFVGWNPHGFSSITVGMADSGAEGFQWLSNGIGCRSFTNNHPCGGTWFNYSVPNNNFTAIRGVGRAKNTGHIYAWYSDSTITEGTASNFTAFSGGKRPFARPLKPNGGSFSMSEMVEADNSDNGQWYYYWKNSSNNTFWRTTGTSVNASANSTAQQVTVSSSHGGIVGFAFGPGSPAPAETFYADGALNISNTSLDLGN